MKEKFQKFLCHLFGHKIIILHKEERVLDDRGKIVFVETKCTRCGEDWQDQLDY
jgi:hypothetical protein